MILTPHNPTTRRGFTLIELMISIAMVLVLILGINQVFRIASDTINAGQALSGADRENRSVQSVLSNDMQSIVTTGGPCVIIRSQQQYAFRNRPDEVGDRDFQNANSLPAKQTAMGTIDINGNNQEGDGNVRGEIIPASAVNSRSHRIDQMMFFANSLFPRQTGSGGGQLGGQGGTQEAFIWYGHLQLPNNQVAAGPYYFNPGNIDGTSSAREGGGGSGSSTTINDNNRFGTQWVLGRVPILLMGDNIDPANPPRFTYIKRSGNDLSPLAENSVVQYPPGVPGNSARIQWSTCDVAQTSIADYHALLSDPNNWRGGKGWWETVGGVRFWANPSPTRPLTADKIARATPIFVQGCSQFIVEYAGDFLTQAPAPRPTVGTDPPEGKILGTIMQDGKGDGVTDFIVARVPLNPAVPNGPSTTVRRTRWYGFPRNVDTSDDTAGPMIRGGAPGTDANLLIDVVPLRDVIATFTGGGNSIPPIERTIRIGTTDRDINQYLPMRPNYAAPNAVPAGAKYVAAWGPGELARGSAWKPTMLRITMVIDDPAGRMSDGQRYEYVFNLP